MQVLGMLLIVLTYCIMVLHVYSYFTVILHVLKRRLGIFFGLIWVAIGIALMYNIVWNYFWACIIRPGGPLDLKINEHIRKEVKNRDHRKAAKVALDDHGNSTKEVEDDRFEGLQKDVKRLMKYRTKTMHNLNGFWSRKCEKCNELKPARTHHCSICDCCVFQMNHHCPFTNNCVGLENQRFFLLFILYAMIGCFYYLVSCAAIWGHYIVKDNEKMMHFLVAFDTITCFLLMVYNIFSWTIACSGLTMIEFIGRQTGYKANYYDYTFARGRDNLFKIFGTKSYFQMLSPSLRYNAFNGIEWSFQQKDLGFNEYGEVSQANDEESKTLSKPSLVGQSIEMTRMEDAEGDEEIENAEIAI